MAQKKEGNNRQGSIGFRDLLYRASCDRRQDKILT